MALTDALHYLNTQAVDNNFIKQFALNAYIIKGLDNISRQLKLSECFPDLLEVPTSYLERVEYVGQIKYAG